MQFLQWQTQTTGLFTTISALTIQTTTVCHQHNHITARPPKAIVWATPTYFYLLGFETKLVKLFKRNFYFINLLNFSQYFFLLLSSHHEIKTHTHTHTHKACYYNAILMCLFSHRASVVVVAIFIIFNSVVFIWLFPGTGSGSDSVIFLSAFSTNRHSAAKETKNKLCLH